MLTNLSIGEVEVSRIQDVVWKTSALQNLVICENEKRILTAIIKSQMTKKAEFDDFVDGKGMGFAHWIYNRELISHVKL